MDNQNGNYAITEQGDLGLGLTPITEDYKDNRREEDKDGNTSSSEQKK